MSPKLVGAALLAVLAVAIVLFILVLPSPPQPATPTALPTSPAPSSVAGPASVAADFSASAPSSVAPSARAAVLSEDEWVDRLDNLLTTGEDNSATARKLLAALRDLPPEAQEEYVAHAVNLCEDEDYAQLEKVYLGTDTPPAVIETIFDDALNRSDELKLPMLAKTLRNPAHPMAGESREILEMYLDVEPGTVPAAGWEAAVQQYLRDEAAAP